MLRPQGLKLIKNRVNGVNGANGINRITAISFSPRNFASTTSSNSKSNQSKFTNHTVISSKLEVTPPAELLFTEQQFHNEDHQQIQKIPDSKSELTKSEKLGHVSLKEYAESTKFEVWSTANSFKQSSGLYVYNLNPKTKKIDFKFRGPVKKLLLYQLKKSRASQETIDNLTKWEWFKIYCGFLIKFYLALKLTMYCSGVVTTYSVIQNELEDKEQIRWEFSKSDNQGLKKKYGNLSNAKVQRKRVAEAALKMFFDKKFIPSEEFVDEFFEDSDEVPYHQKLKDFTGENTEKTVVSNKWNSGVEWAKIWYPGNNFVRRWLFQKYLEVTGTDLKERIGFDLPEYIPTKGFIETLHYYISGKSDIYKYLIYLKTSQIKKYRVIDIIHSENEIVYEYQLMDRADKIREPSYLVVQLNEEKVENGNYTVKIKGVYDYTTGKLPWPHTWSLRVDALFNEPDSFFNTIYADKSSIFDRLPIDDKFKPFNWENSNVLSTKRVMFNKHIQWKVLNSTIQRHSEALDYLQNDKNFEENKDKISHEFLTDLNPGLISGDRLQYFFLKCYRVKYTMQMFERWITNADWEKLNSGLLYKLQRTVVELHRKRMAEKTLVDLDIEFGGAQRQQIKAVSSNSIQISDEKVLAASAKS